MTYLEGERARRRAARRTAPSASKSANALAGRLFARGSEQLQPALAAGEALPSPTASPAPPLLAALATAPPAAVGAPAPA